MSQKQQSPDEEVYQENKRAAEHTVVYETEHAETPDNTAGRASQDEISAESFPASDAPATTATVSGNADTQGTADPA